MTTFDAYYNGKKLTKGDEFGNGWIFDHVDGEILVTHSPEHGTYMRHEPVNVGCELKKFVRTIDMTPTWRGILPYLILSVENGNAEGRKIAIEELQRMADAADAYNASVKE